MKKNEKYKDCGILLPIFSLNGKYGIGALGDNAYKFVDFLNSANQKYWQVLPLGHTSYGDSPYQTFSSNAGNPYFIDIDELIKEGLLDEGDIECASENEGYIDYGKLYKERYVLLGKIRVDKLNHNEFKEFCDKNDWLHDYALFMALKKKHNDSCWAEWEEKYRFRDNYALQDFAKNNAGLLEQYKIYQYLFFKQWRKLKEYANSRSVEIIGDMPIYVAYDSVDVWANKAIFYLDNYGRMIEVAGVPPDYFSSEGQLWGNPLYDWEALAKSNYDWWIERIKISLEQYDVVRIDHFRGFETYWAVPSSCKTAKAGKWKKGPAMRFFDVLKKKLPHAKIIAEDLGEKSEKVMSMLNATGYPGMKVLQFGLLESEKNEHFPVNYTENFIAYTGTHDNDTIQGWFNSLSEDERKQVAAKLEKKELAEELKQEGKNTPEYEKNLNLSLIKMLYESPAKTVIIPIQDFLELDSVARINTPSTLGNNWRWRLTATPSNELAKKIKKLSTAGRAV